jgi:hypothetical protein
MSGKDHWLSKVRPLGSSRVEIAYQRTFTAAESEKLRTGLWPQSMDDKWVIYLGESSLDMWRSWTGHCIYSLPARSVAGGVSVGPLLVNGDGTQYCRISDKDDIQFVERLLNWAMRDENDMV